MALPNRDNLGNLLGEAREYGHHLALLLGASHFTPAEKEAWAFLIPQMTAEQLKQFERLLRADVAAEAKHELSDLLVAIQASAHKRDLSLAALQTETTAALNELELQLKAAG